MNIGGPAIQAVSLCDHFSNDMYRSLLVCGEVDVHEGDMVYLAKEKGVDPFVVHELGREISFFDDVTSLSKLRKIIKTFKPDIIHTHTAKAGTLGRLAGISVNATNHRGRRIKFVHTFHGHVFHSYFSPRKTRIFINIERFLSKFTDRIIVISKQQEQDICQRYRIAGEEKVRIIPLGLDLAKFMDAEKLRRSSRKKYRLPPSGDTCLVGIIGRLANVKNHRMFLRTIKSLKDAGREGRFKFLIVGDGELKENLMKEASDLAVADSVRFAGWEKSMPEVYSALDIVALTSLNEGTPVSLIEAMASKKPVVSTDVGGVRDLIGSIDREHREGYKLAENGVLVPADNHRTLADALIFLSQHPEISSRMAERARRFVSQRYSLGRLVEDLDSLYREMT
ncbi:MAG: glycosyltransferase [Deltaproteobacteria bacterium]|nr:glycosyltransferase [Deltaproteobacteria bacterium]